ncbi:Gamma-glutamyltransferase [Handroanthus impetiginosus]|uniref:Glutathione hydrolase n=1 Tax=Handroanthus impetiginosus TaxID=429701 RepID=A0A2G9GKA8_9LAMI|nr:Gamma-glutamyltransferase [Handroanthus impetiginosus]
MNRAICKEPPPMSWNLYLRLFLLLSSFYLSIGITITNQKNVRIVASHGVVATDHGQCSAIGRDILRKGGHAVDAAVAAALCLGVVSPASSGIGGGAFMLVRSADGKTEAYDMRETAPKLASQNMYGGNAAIKANGPLSIAVPSELAGLEKAWKKYGTIPWTRLVRPAAGIAENGFKISPYLHMQMRSTEAGIMGDEGLRNIFTSNGSLLQSGDLCYNKQLARTLRIIARFGTKAFYNGTIGFSLVKDVKKAGGILTVEDLHKYEVKLRKPVSLDVMGVEIFSMPPPSSGGASMSLILNILAQYQNLSDISDALLTHREIEALKNALVVRMNLGDPDFVDVKSVLKDMLSEKFAAELRKTILDNTTFNSSHYGGRWNQIHDHGTSHISIVDRQRNAVSMTTTINVYFGSKFLSTSTGIILNNEMDDFSMPANSSENAPPPAPANFIYPGKRPLSSMTPTIIVKDGHLKAVVGASGGSFIIAGTTEVILNHFVRGMDPLSSVLAPRSYHQLIPNILQYENWTVPTGDHFEVPAEIRAALQKKGHILRSIAGGTICQFIVQELHNMKSGQLIGVSDPRKGGFPAGF